VLKKAKERGSNFRERLRSQRKKGEKDAKWPLQTRRGADRDTT